MVGARLRSNVTFVEFRHGLFTIGRGAFLSVVQFAEEATVFAVGQLNSMAAVALIHRDWDCGRVRTARGNDLATGDT